MTTNPYVKCPKCLGTRDQFSCWLCGDTGLVPERMAASYAGNKHSHYFKPCPFEAIDVYRVLELFAVTDPAIAHAVKKLLVAGGRGHKDLMTDVQDAIDTLTRWQVMRAEDRLFQG